MPSPKLHIELTPVEGAALLANCERMVSWRALQEAGVEEGFEPALAKLRAALDSQPEQGGEQQKQCGGSGRIVPGYGCTPYDCPGCADCQPQKGGKEVPYTLVKALAAYRWGNGEDRPWPALDELTQTRWETIARKYLEPIWPALEAYFGPATASPKAEGDEKKKREAVEAERDRQIRELAEADVRKVGHEEALAIIGKQQEIIDRERAALRSPSPKPLLERLAGELEEDAKRRPEKPDSKAGKWLEGFATASAKAAQRLREDAEGLGEETCDSCGKKTDDVRSFKGGQVFCTDCIIGALQAERDDAREQPGLLRDAARKAEREEDRTTIAVGNLNRVLGEAAEFISPDLIQETVRVRLNELGDEERVRRADEYADNLAKELGIEPLATLPPESQEGPDRWCRECGLRLTASTPPSVHTGHIHKPIDHWIIDAAASVWAVAKVVADGGDQSGVEALRPRLSAFGITEQAVEMFLRQNPASESQEGER